MLNANASIRKRSAALFDVLLLLCCWPITTGRCRPLQASMPSCHVCSRVASSTPPQFPYQEPARAQQLSLSVFLMTPQMGHEELAIVVAVADVGVQNGTQRSNAVKVTIQSKRNVSTYSQPHTYVCRPSRPPTMCDQHLRCWHSRNFCSNSRQVLNNSLCRIS